MALVDHIDGHWSWAGISAEKIEATNAFGNVIVEDTHGRFWRICPEELSAQIVANSRDDLIALMGSEEFQEDWAMSNLVDMATEQLGEPTPSEVFYLVIPAVLGGGYSPDNFRRLELDQLLCHAGDMAAQIADLPNGAQVRLVVED